MISLGPVIDFHSHVLPEIDDGSGCVEESIAMLRLEAEQGVTHVVATPHFYPSHDGLEEFLDRRSRAEEALRREMAKHAGLPELLVGAEVYYFHGMSQSDALPLLTIGDKACIMIEMPHSVWKKSVYQELQQIHSRFGLTPVIAHVDRYIAPLQTHRIPERLAELPVMVQANADFFLNKRTAGMAARMAKAGRLQLLGSDCHNLDSRKPNLGPALQILESRAGAEAMQYIGICGKELLKL